MFSFTGFTEQEFLVDGSSVINVTLAAGELLDEVVVTGYAGATNSSKITSAIATVSAESIEQIPITSLDQMLQGQAAGVNVNPGATSSPVITISAITTVVLLQLSVAVQVTVVVPGVQRSILKFV